MCVYHIGAHKHTKCTYTERISIFEFTETPIGRPKCMHFPLEFAWPLNKIYNIMLYIYAYI